MISKSLPLSSHSSSSLLSYKQAVAQSFGRSAATYATQAQMQKDCAIALIDLLAGQPVPDGDLLEIGCGTGFVTQRLIQRFPQRSITVTDLSEAMLQFCRSQLAIPAATRIQFQQMDGEAVPPAPYALIVSGFVIQWFRDPVHSLLKLLQLLQPGGLLLISFPTVHSFPEWRELCKELKLPFTANPLPDPQRIVTTLSQAATAHHTIETMLPLQFVNAAEFLRSFKTIGANASQTGQQLSVKQMRQLMQTWDGRSAQGIQVHCHVCFGVFQR